jgi:hypothetical protein
MNHENEDTTPGVPGTEPETAGLAGPASPGSYPPPGYQTPLPGNTGSGAGARDPQQATVPWSALDVIAIIFMVVIAIVLIFTMLGALISMASTMIPGFDSSNFKDSLWVTAGGFFAQWAVTLGVAFTYLKLRGYRIGLGTLGFGRPVSWGESVALILGLLFAFYMFLGLYDTLINQLMPDLMPAPQEVGEWYGYSFIGFLVAVSQVSIITPVVELYSLYPDLYPRFYLCLSDAPYQIAMAFDRRTFPGQQPCGFRPVPLPVNAGASKSRTPA